MRSRLRSSLPLVVLALRVHLATRLNGLDAKLTLSGSQVNVVGDACFGPKADINLNTPPTAKSSFATRRRDSMGRHQQTLSRRTRNKTAPPACRRSGSA